MNDVGRTCNRMHALYQHMTFILNGYHLTDVMLYAETRVVRIEILVGKDPMDCVADII